jgi:putative drug exporter of the RND superfamily
MGALARWSYRHRRMVVASWMVLLVALLGISTIVGSDYRNDNALPGTDSQRAVNLLKRDFPAQSGEADTIVWSVRSGSVRDAVVRARIAPMLRRVAQLPRVRGVVSPYAPGGTAQVSQDGQVAFATVTFDARGDLVPLGAVKDVVGTARAAQTPALQIDLGGRAIARTERSSLALTELIGVVGAGIVLLVAFGSLLAMLLPLASAIAGLGAGLSAIALLSRANQ